MLNSMPRGPRRQVGSILQREVFQKLFDVAAHYRNPARAATSRTVRVRHAPDDAWVFFDQNAAMGARVVLSTHSETVPAEHHGLKSDSCRGSGSSAIRAKLPNLGFRPVCREISSSQILYGGYLRSPKG